MKFNLDMSIEILEKTPSILTRFLSGLSSDWIENNEGPNTWSPYDVLGHIIHGEKTDWIPRARIILSDRNDKTFIPFDRFAQMNMMPQPLEEMLVEFALLRTQNLEELRDMNINLEKLAWTGLHPELGEVSLQQLLSSWVVHDLGHIAQVSRVMAKQYAAEVGPWTAYLGILDS